MRMAGNLDIIEHTELRKQTDILKRTGDAALRDLIRLQSDDALTIKNNRPFRRLVHTREQIERRCLAGTIRPDEPNQLTLLEINIEIRYSLKAAEHLGNMLRFEQYLCHYLRPPLNRWKMLKFVISI